jgi:DNA-binding PadR family transcriptional regulator
MSTKNPLSISPMEHRILTELQRLGEAYPIELLRKSKQPLNRRGLYTQLERLERKGFVTPIRRRNADAVHYPWSRTFYRVSEQGKRMLEAWNTAAALVQSA